MLCWLKTRQYSCKILIKKFIFSTFVNHHVASLLILYLIFHKYVPKRLPGFWGYLILGQPPNECFLQNSVECLDKRSIHYNIYIQVQRPAENSLQVHYKFNDLPKFRKNNVFLAAPVKKIEPLTEQKQ